MVCPGCGEKIEDDSLFCGSCGYKIDKKTEEAQADGGTRKVVVQPMTQRANKIVIYSAMAVVVLVVIGIIWAVGGSKKNIEESQSQTDASGDNLAEKKMADPEPLTPEQINRLAGNLRKPSQPVNRVQPDTVNQVQQPSEPSVAGKPAQKPANGLNGRWEGTWRSGFNDSGSCSVTIRQNHFRALCYDSQFSGGIIHEKRGAFRFEGGGSSWSCRLFRDGVKQVLRCSFSADDGVAGSKSGDLSLYR